MSRELDRRDFTMNRMSATRENQLRSLASDVSDSLPGEHRVRIMDFDPRTGNPAELLSEAAPAKRGNYVQRALNHVQSIGQAVPGTWTRHVTDLAAVDIGKLNKWTLDGNVAA